MLDVHAPHKKIDSVKEFLLHLFTITIGLFIATQIESCVQWREHKHLAEKAREELHTEIESNLKDLKLAIPGVEQWQQQVHDNAATLSAIINNPNDKSAQGHGIAANINTTTFNNAAWRTAQSTGALNYMPYDEVEQLSDLYKLQADLESYQDKPLEDTAKIIGLARKFNLSLNKGVVGQNYISTDQARELAEVNGELQTHLFYGGLLLKECAESSAAYLEHRKPKSNYSESIK